MNDESPGKLIERALGELDLDPRERNAEASNTSEEAVTGDLKAFNEPTSVAKPAGNQISLEDALQTIEERQAMAVTPQTSETAGVAPQGLEQLLIRFDAGKTALAVPMSQVAEISERPASTRVPGLSRYFPGVVNLRGEVVILFDLPAFMGHRGAAERCSLLVVHEDEQPIAGVLVDSVHGIAPYPHETLRKPAVAAEHALKTAEIGALEFGERYYSIVDLLEMLRSSDIAAALGISS